MNLDPEIEALLIRNSRIRNTGSRAKQLLSDLLDIIDLNTKKRTYRITLLLLMM